MTSLLGTSAWIAPAQAITKLVRMIVLDTGEVCTCSIPDSDKTFCIGQFVTIGRNGWTAVPDIWMDGEEFHNYLQSIDMIKEVNKSLKNF